MSSNLSEQLAHWFRSTPAGRAFVEKDAAAQQATRRNLARQIRELEQEKAATRVDEKLAGAQAALATAKEQLNAAQRAVEHATRERRAAILRIEFQQSQLVRELQPLVAPAIADAVTRLNSKVDWLRRNGLKSETRPGLGHDDQGRPRQVTWSNRRAIERLCQAIADAREAIARLTTDAPDDLAAAICAIEDSIPWKSIDQLEPM